MFHSSERRFFFDGKNKNKIGLCFDPRMVERAYRGEYCLDVASIVSDSRSENFALAYLGLDLQAFLKDGIQMRVKHDRLPAPGALAKGDEITFRVIVDLVQLQGLKHLAHCFG